MLCHQGTTIKVISKDISDHIAHGDYYGECLKEQNIETTNVVKPEIIKPETIENIIRETEHFPDSQVNPVSEIPEKILTPQETNTFVDLIINTMNSIFALVYEIEDNPRLEQWTSDVIQDRVERTQDKIFTQLETTQGISQLKAESDKILNPVSNPQPTQVKTTASQIQITSEPTTQVIIENNSPLIQKPTKSRIYVVVDEIPKSTKINILISQSFSESLRDVVF